MSMLLRRRHTESETEGVAKKVAPSPSPQKKAESTLEYTEESINAMNGAKLRKLAKANGIASPEELTASELKAILCEILVK